MKRIQYNVVERETKNASGKAKRDVCKILRNNGFNEMYHPYNQRFLRLLQQLWHIYKLNAQTLLFVQYPANILLCYKFLMRKCLKKVAIIHDLESLRGIRSKEEEIKVLNAFEIVISHNQCMSSYLRRSGLTTHIVDLNLFDYLLPVSVPVSENRDKHCIAFAGNLSKSRFLSHIGLIKGLQFNIYGATSDNLLEIKNNQNVDYRGSFSSEELISHIEGGWGLVWDGTEVGTCEGIVGEYMRYNSPHKVSMYIVSERPVIVWKESAISTYIVKHHLGFTVNSLYEIPDRIEAINEEEYQQMLSAVRKEKERLTKGEHLNEIVKHIIEQYNGKETI